MVDSARVSAGPTEASREPRSSVVPAWVVFWTSTLGIAVVTTLHNLYVFRGKVFEDGDYAANSLLAISAQHFDQFVGNYSRVGFHHPGPALIYMLAAGQFVFFSVLHVVPGQFNGQLLGVIVFASALLGLVVTALYRTTRSLTAAAVGLGVMLIIGSRFGLLAQVWFPFVYMCPFLLLVVAGAAVATGRTVELPSFVLAGCLLVHGHVSFIMFVGVTVVAVGAWWWTAVRDDWRAELRAHRIAVRGSALILALALLPMVVELILHFPGPWTDYLKYSSADHEHRTVAAVLQYFKWYWSPASRVPIVLIAAAAVLGAALLATERVTERRRLFIRLYALCALETILLVVYLATGVDHLSLVNRYVGYFYLTVPMLVVLLAAVQLALRVEPVLSRGALGRSRAGRVIVGVLVGCLLVAGAVSQGLHNQYPAHAYFGTAVTALDRAPERDGRVIEIDAKDNAWTPAGAIALEAQRRGVPWCVVDTQWTRLIFGGRHICHGTAPRWTVVVLRPPPGQPIPDPPGTVVRLPTAAVVVEPDGPGTVH